MSTIFLTAPNTHDNIANIVMKSSWEVVKTLQLNSHETSLNNGCEINKRSKKIINEGGRKEKVLLSLFIVR